MFFYKLLIQIQRKRQKMKYFATLYSIVFGSATLWAWTTFFSYRNSEEEHLLPAIILEIVTLPSSLLMDKLIVWFPWLLNSSTFMLSLITALGFIQVLSVWLLAKWSAKGKEG